MAWGFKYKIKLHLTHPTMDPDVISKQLADIEPSHTAKAGEPVQRESGRVRVPSLSVWQARLHEEAWLHTENDDSENNDFSNVLRTCLEKLAPHSELFKDIQQEGWAYLRVVHFSDTTHCVNIIKADVLQQCASLGLDLDLEFYAPDRPEVL